MNQASYVPWYVKAKAKLREERHRSPDKTQAWLANELGISESSVSHYFSGRHSPNLRTIKRIAELLNLSLAELIEDDDSICQDRAELGVLRNLRALPEDKRKQLIELIDNYTKGVTLTPSANANPPHHLKPQ
jgi:transcriptional regulator with XRE-family HTH domain